MAERTNPTVEDLKAPLLAAVGAADLALERVNEIVTTLLERAGEARSDASGRVEETRDRIAKLQEDLPERAKKLRGRLRGGGARETARGYRERACRGRAAAAAQPPRVRGASGAGRAAV